MYHAVILSLTSVISGKWQSTEPTKGQFNFKGLDALVNWATANNQLVRGHTTLWHAQLPSWVSQINDRTTLTSVIQNHVTTEIGRYKGKIYGWVCHCLATGT